VLKNPLDRRERIAVAATIRAADFGHFAHRIGLSRAKVILSSLYDHALPRARQRFTEVEDP
jgi:hypothetical protein